MIHRDRARAGSFGANALRYDRSRPRYPASLVDDLLPAGHVLDVGCGTGIAAAAFAARGCVVLGVEPDERMAAVARAKGIEVEIGTFEEWASRGRTYDLVISGQAWHWVDPERGPAKAASVLAPGGRLGVFWNFGRHDAAIAALDEVYDRHAPALRNTAGAFGRVTADRGATDAAHLAAAGFAAPEVRTYPWTATYTAAEWVDQLRTHSDHALLDDGVRDSLLADIAATIDRLGGTIAVAYDTVLVTAVRP